jgi:hypothetical protein
MGLADRLKAIETSQQSVQSTQSVVASAPPLPQHDTQPHLLDQPVQQLNYPTSVPQQLNYPTSVPQQLNYPPQQPNYLPQQPNYQPSVPQQPNYPHQQPNYQPSVPQQPSSAPAKKETGFLASLTSKFAQKVTIQHNTPGPYYNAIKQRVDSVIEDKNLQYFYPVNSPQYNTLLIRLSHIDFPAIAAKRKIPVELAFDLAALGVTDVILFIDDSGSMNFDEQWNTSTEKTDDLKLILSRVVDIASMFDDDGLCLRFFNSSKEFDNITNEQEALNALGKVHYNGGTPIGRSLVTKILEPFVYAKARNNKLIKPLMIYVITDGVPDNKPELKDNIRKCKEWLSHTSYGKSAVNIMFAQVGNSPSAAQYLKDELDNDPDIGEDVDTTGNFEMEYEKYKTKGVDLTPDLWLLQMTLGSIVRAYDEGND